MLDVSDENCAADEQRNVGELWGAVEIRVKLPKLTAKYFFDPNGPMPSQSNSRRSFHRFYMRSKAVLVQGTTIYGGYTTDISRQGIGFLSPRQVLPKSKWTLKLPNGTEYELVVTRCRRENDGCFACGSRFSTPSLARSARPEDGVAENLQ